jgi:hypothetical protein
MSKRREKRARVAIPVKMIMRDPSGAPRVHPACTLDVTARGVRLAGIHNPANPGDVVRVERGSSKAMYQVRWVGRREEGRYGQLGLQCVEAVAFDWGIPVPEQRDDHYFERRPASSDPAARQQAMRYLCQGNVEVTVSGSASLQFGQLRDISALGCYVRMGFPPETRSAVKLKIKIPAYASEIFAKGIVGISDRGIGMWVSFTELSAEHGATLLALVRQLQAAS